MYDNVYVNICYKSFIYNLNYNYSAKVREEYARQGKTLLPLDLRPKLTRKERLRLPNNLRFKKTPKQRELIKKYPRRKFAVIDRSKVLPKNVRELNVKNVLSEKKAANRYYHYLRKKQDAFEKMRIQQIKKKRKKKKREEKKKEKENKSKDKK